MEETDIDIDTLSVKFTLKLISQLNNISYLIVDNQDGKSS